MSGYTKEDYDNLYSIRVRLWDEAIQGYTRSRVRLNYHRNVMGEMVRVHWDHVVPLLGLTDTDKVVVVGAGFGWGVERLLELTNCSAVGVDISTYIGTSKDTTENDEVISAIIAAGYDPLTGHGLDVMNACTTEPRSKTVILNEDMYSTKSRNRVKKALGNSQPTWIITEDMLSDFSDEEVVSWKEHVDKLGVPVCHILRDNSGLNPKTLEEWHDLTGHVVVSVGTHRRVG